ncbi:MAG TPA: hypothetical protein PLW02_03820 [Verrucomicrobiota bacterium]|nr:hypothetical protein [Verrucomicrobiota bacterium]
MVGASLLPMNLEPSAGMLTPPWRLSAGMLTPPLRPSAGMPMPPLRLIPPYLNVLAVAVSSG